MQFMTINEVSRVLSVHRSTVERLIKSGQLQAIKVNSSVRILEDSFDDFVKRNLLNESAQKKDKTDAAVSNDAESTDMKKGGSTLRSMMKHFVAISGSKEECDKMVDSSYAILISSTKSGI